VLTRSKTVEVLTTDKPPVITAPDTLTLQGTDRALLSTIQVSDANANDQVTVVLKEATQGFFDDGVSDTKTVTLSGLPADVDQKLALLTYVDFHPVGVPPSSDTITVTATDSFGATASKTVDVVFEANPIANNDGYA